MSLKNSLFSCLFLPLGLFPAGAQVATTGSGGMVGKNIADHLLIKDANRAIYGEPDEDVVGTPYLNKTFIEGDIYYSKGKFLGIPMRYNIYDDNIEFKQNGSTYILDPSLEIAKIDMGDYALVVARELRGKLKPAYFVLLDSGKVTLMAKKHISFRESRPPGPLDSQATPARFSELPDDYFYRIGDGELMKVGSIRKMIESFPDKQKELSQFADREKISSNKEKELIKLVHYYNGL